jgi:Putative Flp pilus-assembly TadE/G-like
VQGELGNCGCRRRLRDERGQVVVMFALLVPVLFALGAIVLDVGNWYVHKRHLQTQVDAAAFAGATKFVGCSFQFGDPIAANRAIRAEALSYAGDTARVPAVDETFNRQLGEPRDVRVVLNGSRYWQDGDPEPIDPEGDPPGSAGYHPTDPTSTGYGLDDSFDPDGNPATPNDACSTRALDVKATDHDVAPLWGLLPATPSPKAKAKVEIRQIREQMRMLPFAVPEIDPAAVVALFVDEDDGTVLASQALQQVDDPDLPFSEWSTYPLEQLQPVFVGSDNVGVVILVSKENAFPQRTGPLAGICGQAPNLVACYGGSTATSGLSFIHGFSGIGGSPSSPQIRDVNVQDFDCEADDDSAPYFLLTGDCDVTVRAIIDFGLDVDPTLDPEDGGISAEVVVHAPGCPNRGCDLEYDSQSVDDESIWFATDTATMPAADSNDNGRQDFEIEWTTLVDDPTTPELDPEEHNGTFTGVAHPYVANDLSGPVLYLELSATKRDPASGAWLPVFDANSVNKGNEYRYTVDVGLVKPLQLRDPLEDPLLLRYASPSGSLNQALDCDKAVPLTDEVTNGCETSYGLNYYDWDNDGDTPKTWADITCSGYGTGDLPPESTTNNPAPICVAAKTGDVIAFVKGLEARFEKPVCTPNNWPETEEEIVGFFGEDGYDFANDPRFVTLVITDITAFEGSGSTNIPVKYFAGFYATGWDISSHTTGCPGENDPHPIFGTGYKKSKDNGDVWGHFINVIEFSSSGLADDQLCNFDELGNCIAVLVE